MVRRFHVLHTASRLTSIFSISPQANSWHLTGKAIGHRTSSAWRAVPNQQQLVPGLHLAFTPKQLVGPRAAVLSSTAISGTMLAMEEPTTQHCITANNAVAPETLYYDSYDQPINSSLSYMKSLTIRCVQDPTKLAGQLQFVSQLICLYLHAKDNAIAGTLLW